MSSMQPANAFAMSVLSVRNVFPVVIAIAATLFLITAVQHDLVPEAAAVASASR